MGRRPRDDAAARHARRELAAGIAEDQAGMLSRRQLYGLGFTRWQVKAELVAGRWFRTGRQTVRIGPEQEGWQRWRAVLEVGPGAAVDGITALQVAGLRTIEEDIIHVAVPKSANPRPCAGVRVHETRRYRREDVLTNGLPRMRPEAAAVHAALWAVSDVQAALFVVASVQQRLVSVAKLAEQVALVKRHPRRQLLHDLVADVAGGVHSMGEREFARHCRKRGLPEPSRQVRRVTDNGTFYLDNDFDPYDLTVEIDGAQHLDAVAAAADCLKQNAGVLNGRIVLRIPVWALRTDPDPFMDQVEQILEKRGWKRRTRRRLRPKKLAS